MYKRRLTIEEIIAMSEGMIEIFNEKNIDIYDVFAILTSVEHSVVKSSIKEEPGE